MKVSNCIWIPSNLNQLSIYNGDTQNQRVMDMDKEDQMYNHNLEQTCSLQVVTNKEKYGNAIDVDLM